MTLTTGLAAAAPSGGSGGGGGHGGGGAPDGGAAPGNSAGQGNPNANTDPQTERNGRNNGVAGAQEPPKDNAARNANAASAASAREEKRLHETGNPTDETGAPSKSKNQAGPPTALAAQRVNHDLTHTLRIKSNGRDHELAWTPTNASTLGYQIWRSNSPFALIADLPAERTNFVDEAAPSNSKYKVTYFTEQTIESGFVPASAEPAALPEWNAQVYAAASAQAPIVVEVRSQDWSTWVAVIEAAAFFGLLGFAIARPDVSARALRSTRSSILRGTARLTLSTIVVGEAVERRLRLRFVSRMTDHEILDLFHFMMSPEAAPKEVPAPPEAPPIPRLSVSRLHRPESMDA